MALNQIIEEKLPQKYQKISDVFRMIEFDELPPSRDFDHRIKLKPGHRLEELPVSSYTEKEIALIEDFIDGMLSRGLITHSKAVAASEIYFECSGTQRLPKVSFKQLNAATNRVSFEHPTPLNIIRSVRGAAVYTKLVIQNVHEQILLNKNDAHRTTFSTPFGKFKFKTLPFGLVDAIATIQEMVDEILEIPHKNYVVAYQDNILVYSWKPSCHTGHVKNILQCLEENEILLDINNCEFDSTELLFLGYKLGYGMYTVNPIKCKELIDTPYPKSKGELKSFIGKARYWAQFIPEFASKASPLSYLTHKSSSFTWDQEAADAFSSLKCEFSSPAWLEMPNPSLDYIIHIDHDPLAYSATLMQEDDENEFILGYFSTMKTDAQQAYDEVDDEAYSILLALEHWEDLLNYTPEAIEVRCEDSFLADMDYVDIAEIHGGAWYSRFTDFNFFVESL